MAHFRSSTSTSDALVSLESVRQLAREVIAPAHFFTGPEITLEWHHVDAEELIWEIFRGRLLDPAHTRQRRTFEAWNVYQSGPDDRSAEPLLALKLDAESGLLHVVRGLECYVWEGYDSGGNVILSRERRKWVRELVGTVQLDRFANLNDLRDELICQLFRAVVGSRLPLLSAEAPLPAFSFGTLFYCYRSGETDRPLHSWRELTEKMLSAPLAWLEKAKLLETFLHAVPAGELGAATTFFVDRWKTLGHSTADLTSLLRTLYNEVSLSPWTDLADKTLAFLDVLENQSVLDTARVADFLGYLLRQLGRHLTAYDLVTFHHRGANYPDALLLDAVLKAYLRIIERRPELFIDTPEDDEHSLRLKRLRRRALRQGWLLRRRYEGHPVPDLTTSPGENNRILPPSHPRVPEEQILHSSKRTKLLYADDPLPWPGDVLRQSVMDLHHPDERRELGMALFLDRPLGTAKAPGEPDGTLLLSCEAYSGSIARQRLLDLAREERLAEDVQGLPEEPPIRGLPLDAVGGSPRPGIVSLTDARQASPDFVFLRTTPSSVRALLDQFDFTPLITQFKLDFLTEGPVFIARVPSGAVIIYDEEFRPRVELEIDASEGYASRAGQEYPVAGLRVVCVREQVRDGEEVRTCDLRLAPR
jgi:hypothetical protein